MIHRLRSKLLSSREGVTVGRYTYGSPTVLSFPSGGQLYIGAFCSIADEVAIMLGGNHNSTAVTTYPLNALWEDDGLPIHETTKGDVRLGNDVWVGYGALILSGVTIGDGAIIGASAVVVDDVEPFAVVAGNPARLLRYRWDEETREAVKASRWWDWPEEKIRAEAPRLMADARCLEGATR